VYTQQSQATRPANQIAVGYILAFAGPLLISISVSIYVNMLFLPVPGLPRACIAWASWCMGSGLAWDTCSRW